LLIADEPLRYWSLPANSSRSLLAATKMRLSASSVPFKP